MKKAGIISLVLLLCCYYVPAQNYQCVQPTVIRYFDGPGKYLRGIRIDNVSTANGNTIMYPFKTARGAYGPSDNIKMKGSWLGEEIIVEPGGRHLFDTYWGDTVIIKAKAGINEAWIFYDDTAAVYYEAAVTSIDTMTVLNVLDSVKTITLTVKDSNGIIAAHAYNNLKIVISKDHGFVNVFSLYMFPHIPIVQSSVEGYDYFTYLGGGVTASYHLTDYHNPKMTEIYDFQPGDVFQYRTYNKDVPKNVQSVILDSIITRKNISADTIEYYIRSVERAFSAIPPVGYHISDKYHAFTVTTGTLINPAQLPEEWGVDYSIYYSQNDTQFCDTNKYYSIRSSYISYSQNGTAYINTFEPCGIHHSYKKGLGQLSSSVCMSPTMANPSNNLFYTRKNNQPCGKYISLDVETLYLKELLSLYPNPTSGKLYIETGLSGKAHIIITDLAGRVLLDTYTTSGSAAISTEHLSNGIYLINLIAEDGGRSAHKFIVQH